MLPSHLKGQKVGVAGGASPGCSWLNPAVAPLPLTVTHQPCLVHRSLSAPPCAATLVCTVARLTHREGRSDPGTGVPASAPGSLGASSKRTSHFADKTRLKGLPFSKGQSPGAGKPHVLPPYLSRCPCHPRGASLPAAARGLLALWFCSCGVEAFFRTACAQGRAGVAGSGPRGLSVLPVRIPLPRCGKPARCVSPREVNQQLRQSTGGPITCRAAWPRTVADSSAAVVPSSVFRS